jgi:uncharacterized protein YpuA (DUF1002 family)
MSVVWYSKSSVRTIPHVSRVLESTVFSDDHVGLNVATSTLINRCVSEYELKALITSGVSGHGPVYLETNLCCTYVLI